MRIAVIGSRGLNVDIAEFIPKNVTEIISGGARGIDSLAERWADENGIPKLIIRPNYHEYGIAAPLLRNKTIVDTAELVVAVWDGKSHGTWMTITYAKKKRKPVKIYVVE